MFERLGLLAVALITSLAVAGCAGGSEPASPAAIASGDGRHVTLRLGHFPNVTHATAIVGVESGIFAEELSPDSLEVQTFNAGPAAVEALFSGAIDAAYIGPNPAINAFARSDGDAIRIIAGATSGGAALVVKPSITRPSDLKDKLLASPQLGNTQDVALRTWLATNGLETELQGGGDVSIIPQENAQTLEAFRSGSIHGAWVPEPWVTRLIQDGGARVLVDEASLWPGGKFVTTHLVVRTKFLQQHPATVRRLLAGQLRANEFLNAKASEAQQLTNRGIEKLTGKRLSDAVMEEAWKRLSFTNDPIPASLAKSAEHAEALGLLPETDLSGIYDLRLLNAALREAGEPEVRQL